MDTSNYLGLGYLALWLIPTVVIMRMAKRQKNLENELAKFTRYAQKQ